MDAIDWHMLADCDYRPLFGQAGAQEIGTVGVGEDDGRWLIVCRECRRAGDRPAPSR
ncbi:MAG TPA: hypothetical protein PLW86_17835 [Rhodocyclaceae bacterium]|nr:hypothetical protein [Rhodocyclaceae bacterium]